MKKHTSKNCSKMKFLTTYCTYRMWQTDLMTLIFYIFQIFLLVVVLKIKIQLRIWLSQNKPFTANKNLR